MFWKYCIEDNKVFGRKSVGVQRAFKMWRDAKTQTVNNQNEFINLMF